MSFSNQAKSSVAVPCFKLPQVPRAASNVVNLLVYTIVGIWECLPGDDSMVGMKMQCQGKKRGHITESSGQLIDVSITRRASCLAVALHRDWRKAWS